jgi:hypothetical protein
VEIPIIFTTGYEPEKTFPARFLNSPTLQKPYDANKLVRSLKSVFELIEGERKEKA